MTDNPPDEEVVAELLQALDVLAEIERPAPSPQQFSPIKDTHSDPMLDIVVHCVINKRVMGGDDADEFVPGMLLDPIECDLHYTQYWSPVGVRLAKHPPQPCGWESADEYKARAKKATDHRGLVFRIMTVDLDHHSGTPTLSDFAALCDLLKNSKLPPNVIYMTKSGAHAMYFIEELTDPDEFEHKHRKLRVGIEHIIKGTAYNVDDNAKDWTRFLRSARVIREDKDEKTGVIKKTDLRENPIIKIHDRLLQTRRWKWAPKPKKIIARRITPACSAAVENARQYCTKVPPAISGEGGNARTYNLVCRLIELFSLNQDQLLEALGDWNNSCEPPWEEFALIAKIEHAERKLYGGE